MAPPADHQPLPAERLISLTIQATWALWLVGGLYLVGPALGWALAAGAAWQLYLGRGTPPGAVPLLWLAGMAAMLLILLAGHATNDLGAGQTLKSAVGWAKGWALMGLFPFAGAVLRIRPATVYRAVCRLGLQTLVLLPLFLAAPHVGLPQLLYVSPLKVLGGSGPEYFAVVLYTFDPETHAARWQFFAPWSPAAGMLAVIYVLCALEERALAWRVTGVAAGLALAFFSQSRLAFVALAVVWPLAHAVTHLRRPRFWFAAAPAMLAAGLFSPQLLALKTRLTDDFTGARAGSSRVRATLGRIAVERWRHEAPWFGHGIVERGPHLVEFMPIGSHHSWYGLLFVKGLSGVVALAVPLAASVALLGWGAARAPAVRVGFAMLVVLVLYSFGENLEALSYLTWPALLLIGCAARALTDADAAPR